MSFAFSIDKYPTGLLREHRQDLEIALSGIDPMKLCNLFQQYGVVTNSLEERFGSLDHEKLDSGRKKRYLLQHIFDENDQIFLCKFMEVLFSLGGHVSQLCHSLLDELRAAGHNIKISGVAGCNESMKDLYLTESHIPRVLEILTEGSHKWEEISIALGLPKHKTEECRSGTSNISRLRNVLYMFITDNNEIPASLSSLKKALASDIVGLSPMALKLDHENLTHEHYSSPNVMRDIVEVEDGKSTLLEIPVSPFDSPLSYQWTKDGQVLCHHDYIISDYISGKQGYYGRDKPILFISYADQGKEGKYKCRVIYDCKEVNTEINLVVIYPPDKKHLLNLYSKFSELPESSWPPTVGNGSFINLALIRKENIGFHDSDYSVRGDMDDILGSKENVTYDSLFSQYTGGTLILIEGRPGSGKTTLVHKITRDWASKGYLRESKLIFLISLRILSSTSQDQTLFDILGQFYSKSKLEMLLHDIDESDGKGICFIIDGLDEFNSPSSVIHKLLNKTLLPLAMIIVASRPIATAPLRNSGKVTTNVEILGFTKGQVYKYIEEYPFASTTMRSELKTYLKSHRNVNHLCYLPVHVAMICFLYSRLGSDIPCTETKIYELFTILLILRHMKRDHSSDEINLTSFQDLTGSNKNIFNSICRLAFDMTVSSKQAIIQSNPENALSYIADSTVLSLGLITIDRVAEIFGYQHSYTFLHLTFQEYLAAVHIFNLGDSKQDNLITLYGGKKSMHKVWSFYCGMVNFNLKLHQFREIIWHSVRDSLYGVQCAFESQQQTCCESVVEIGEPENLAFSNKILTSADFNAIGYIMSKSEAVSSLNFNKCKFSEDDIEVLSTVAGRTIESVHYLTVHGGSEVNIFALNRLLLSLSWLEILDLHKLSVSDFALTLHIDVTLPKLRILKLPKTAPDLKVATLKILKFKSSVLEEVCCSYVPLPFVVHSKWNNLLVAFGFCVSHTPISLDVHNQCDLDFSLITPGRFSHCISVSLINCSVDDSDVSLLTEGMNNSLKIESLILDFNKISSKGATDIAVLFNICVNLKTLSLQCNDIGDSGAKSLANNLANCTELIELNLQCNAFGDEGAVAIVNSIKHYPNALNLYLYCARISEKGQAKVLQYHSSASVYSKEKMKQSWDVITLGGLDAVYCALECCTYLVQLKLQLGEIDPQYDYFPSDNWIYDLELEENFYDTNKLKLSFLVEKLKCSANLKELTLSNVSFQDINNVDYLMEGLKCCKMLQVLDLSSNCFSISSFSVFANNLSLLSDLQALKLSYTLYYLKESQSVEYEFFSSFSMINLEYISVHWNGIIILIKGLKSCINLKKLDLSINDISCYGAAVIADLLQSSRSLRELDLSHNSIGSGGIAILAKAARHNNQLQILNLAYNYWHYRRIRSHKIDCWTKHNSFSLLTSDMDYETAYFINLQTLDMSCNPLSSRVLELANELMYCISLQSLHLSENHLTSDDVIILCEGLKYCTSLRDLNLSSNKIGSEGTSALAGALICSSIESLDISMNSIGSSGAVGLADKSSYFYSLNSLDISSNSITSDYIPAIAEGLKQCKLLEYLNVSGNDISSTAVTALGSELKSCKILNHPQNEAIFDDLIYLLLLNWFNCTDPDPLLSSDF